MKVSSFISLYLFTIAAPVALAQSPIVPPLSQSEVSRFKLLRLWHTSPVVDGFVLPSDYKSANGFVAYVPDQIQGYHARVRKGLAREYACPKDADRLRESGVVAFEGAAQAQAADPVLTEDERQSPRRFESTTTFQAGEDFSVGAWVKFHDPDNATLAMRDNGKFRNMAPAYYTLIGKMRDPEWNREVTPPPHQRLEWQVLLTPESLYFHTYPSNETTDYYASQIIADQYTMYEACRRSEIEEPAIPLSGKRKPVPVPQPRVSGCALPPPLAPPPLIFPPRNQSENKKHFHQWNLKNKFAWAETFSSSYLRGGHYESWHFVNLSFHLADRIQPSVTVTIIASPYFGGDRSLVPSPANWMRKQFNMPIDRELARQIRHESDAPITMGLRRESPQVASQAQALRSGTYIARSALTSSQVDRMATLLYPRAAANCPALELERVK